jgi:hypothetical protein
MKFEQILEELEKIEDLENRLKFLNKLLKDTEDEELKEKIVTLMKDIVSPQVQHYDKSHYRMEFEPSETVEVSEPETKAPTPVRETPERVGPTPEAELRPDEESLTEYTTRLESDQAYTTLEQIEEASRREETAKPENQSTERRLFETVHSGRERKTFIRESPRMLAPTFDTEQPDINPEQLENLKGDLNAREYKTPDQIRDEKMRSYKKRD